MVLLSLLRHDVYNCPITSAWRATVQLMLKSGLLMTNQIEEFWYTVVTITIIITTITAVFLSI